jgi:quinol monooxygenase YgiN
VTWLVFQNCCESQYGAILFGQGIIVHIFSANVFGLTVLYSGVNGLSASRGISQMQCGNPKYWGLRRSPPPPICRMARKCLCLSRFFPLSLTSTLDSSLHPALGRRAILGGGRTIADFDMVIAIVDIKSSLEKREELRQALCSLSGQTEAERGCTSCRLYQEVPDSGVLRIESRWIATSDLLRHIRSDSYKRMLLMMDMGIEPPSIEFYTVSAFRGLDLIYEARQLSD